MVLVEPEPESLLEAFARLPCAGGKGIEWMGTWRMEGARSGFESSLVGGYIFGPEKGASRTDAPLTLPLLRLLNRPVHPGPSSDQTRVPSS
jgi:hypothetical protein